MDPVRFARSAGSKALGGLVYVALIVAFGFIAGVVGAALALGAARTAGLPEPALAAVGIVAGAGSFTLIAWFGWRDFRRRANAEVLVHDAAIEIAAGGERVQFPFAEVEVVRLRFDGSAPTIDLEAVDGLRRRLPPDIAPFDQVEPLLEQRLLPLLLERFRSGFAAGRPLSLRESRARSLGRIGYGGFLLLLSPLMILSIRLLIRGIGVFNLGIARIRQGRRGLGGGFAIVAEGVRGAGEESRVLPWRDLSIVKLDKNGVILASIEGPRVSASLFADNFWPGSRLIAASLGETSGPPTPPGRA